MKYFRMSYDEVVFKRSYLNLILLNRAIPGIKPFNADEEDDEIFDIEEIEKGVKSPKNGAEHASNFFLNFM